MDNIQKTTPSIDRGFSFFTKERIILSSIILFLFFIITYLFINQIDLGDEIIDNKNKIEIVTKENEYLTKKNLDIEKRFIIFEGDIDTLYKKIDKNNIQIDKIKIKTNEKVYIIDSYSVDELEEFFTNRYGNK